MTRAATLQRHAVATPEDPHYFVHSGRRWRRSDPAIPAALSQALVRELMAARRAVGAAKRSGDAEAERAARSRVQDAKVALGERGPRWWEALDEAAQRVRAEATMRALALSRAPDKTLCPSEVARVIGQSAWRAQMPLVRSVAVALALAGDIEVRQRGAVVDAKHARGPLRIASAPARARRRR